MTTPAALRVQLQEIQAERLRLEETTRSEEERRQQDEAKHGAELEDLQKHLHEAEAVETAEMDELEPEVEEARQQPAFPGKCQLSFGAALSLKLGRSWLPHDIKHIRRFIGHGKKETCFNRDADSEEGKSPGSGRRAETPTSPKHRQ